MLKFEATIEVPNLATERNCSAREMLIVAALLCGLAQGMECAADELQTRKLNLQPTQRLAVVAVPPAFQFDVGSLCLPDERATGLSTQFSPRKHFAPDEPLETPAPRADSLRTTTVWQRLKEYRSKDRVRLVTLWETSGSSISLQAGKHGEPSLQWSSRSMNRGGATRGLLDSFVAASLGAAGIAITQPGMSARGAPGSSAIAARPIRPAIAAALSSHAP